MYKFYDTESLMKAKKKNFKSGDMIVSTISLQEIEEMKSYSFAARRTDRLLKDPASKYEVIIYKTPMSAIIDKQNLEKNNDTKIIACAVWCDTSLYPDNVEIITNKPSIYNIANLYFGNDSIKYID